MLVELLPSQIPQAWEGIQASIIESAPIGVTLSQDNLLNIYEALATGRMQCIIACDAGGVGYVVVTVCPLVDVGTGDASLLIYSLYSFRSVPQSLWPSWIDELKALARARGCSSISFYTDDSGVEALVKRLGAITRLYGIFKV